MNIKQTILREFSKRRLLGLVFKDLLSIMLTYRRWLIAAIFFTILSVSLEPSLAWLGKKFVDQLKDESTVSNASLFNYALVFATVLFGLGLLQFTEKVINEVYKVRIILALQRTYLSRRQEYNETQDISRILYDCEQAKKGVDILYKDIWKIIFGVISVLVWQLSIAPSWLPALLLTVVPPILIVFAFGRFVQRASLELLTLQGKIASSTAITKEADFLSHQESFFRQTVRLEIFKELSETLMDLLSWIGLLFLIIIASVTKLPILPQEIDPGDLALFAVNLNLLSKPLGEIGKVYNKGREAYPALLRVLHERGSS